MPLWLEIAKEAAVGLAAIGTVYVALRGLSTWRAKLRGEQAFTAAKALLVHTIHLREAIEMVRNPFMMAAEMDDPPQDDPERDVDGYLKYHRTLTGYRGRLEHLHHAQSELGEDMVEAEALWGSDATEGCRHLMRLGHEVSVKVRFSVDSQHPRNRFQPDSLARDNRDVVYSQGTREQPDDFSSRVNQAVSEVENEFRPYIQKLRTGLVQRVIRRLSS